MSSQYPVLGNKLDLVQLKVTELKEELKRRKLKTSGLKDDLVKRLEEAIRIEREDEEIRNELVNAAVVAEGVDNGVDLENLHVVGVKNAEAVSAVTETVEVVVDDAANRDEKVGDVMVQAGIDESVKAMGSRELQEEVKMGGVNSSRVEEEELTTHATTMETSISVTESVVSELALSVQDVQNSGTQEANENSSIQLENEDSKPQLENESSKPSDENVMLESSAPDNQVSEVNPNLGFQVNSDSISTDSVSINEKIELKDNIIADDVKLELDDVKLEMVEPSSSNVVPVGGESHPMDVEEPQEKSPSVEKKDDSNGTNADMSKKNDSVDVGYSEKLNLDRSSGDDSMEEDVLESKQIDSKYNTDEVGDKCKIKNELPSVKEENLVNVTGKDLSTDQKEIHVENRTCPVAPMEKRKLNVVYVRYASSEGNVVQDLLEALTSIQFKQCGKPDPSLDVLLDQEAVGNTEPLKRQRRWNSESIKVPEQQSSNLTPTTTPNDGFQPTPFRRNFSRSESSVSEEAPKERIVPPSQKPPTNSLRIDRFLRPFTLKAVQELLGKTGSVTSFWMDHIKTHCYVMYSSVEEAVETRNTVYNLQWPPNGGRLLVAEFVDPQEVKIRVDAPPQSPAAPVTPSTAAPAPSPPMLQPQPSPRQQVSRQQLPPPPSLPLPPPLSNPPHVRERVDLPPPPPLPEKHDPPIVTLDDLFRKTKTAPRIYYLPLSEEQVAAKLAGYGKNTKQSAGVACRRELFQPSRGMWFVAGFGFSEDCMMLKKLKVLLALETFQLRALYMSGSPDMWTYLVFLFPKLVVGVERVDPAQHESMQKKGKTAYNSASKDQWIPDFPFLVSAKEMQALSRWCIHHRSKAELVVETWNKQFHNSDMLKKVPLLYLANDILQNSKRKGNEFVAEFWKVLPAALKNVVEKGDDRDKNVVSRLLSIDRCIRCQYDAVDVLIGVVSLKKSERWLRLLDLCSRDHQVNIWEERTVFGSHARSLREVMLGEDAPPPLELSKKRSRTVKNTKRDSRSIRTKFSIGGAAEKIVSAFNLMVSEQPNEEAEMRNCKSAVRRVRNMEKDVDIACSNNDKDPKRKTLAKELEDNENLLKRSIEKLKSAKASRAALVSQLKEALQEQESELEGVRTQIQVAQAQVEEASKMRRRLNGEVLKASSTTTVPVDSNAKAGQTPKRTAAAIAAEVAEKLAASSSSQMIMHAVLSTFAAEEAKNAPKPETSLPVSDPNVFMLAQPLTAPTTHSYQSVLLTQPTMQNQTPTTQSQFHILPKPSSQPYIQPGGGITTPYAYGNFSVLPPGPPPPPPPPYKVSQTVPLAQQPVQMPQQQPLPLAQQEAPINQKQPMSLTQQTLGANFRPQPPGLEYYGHPSHS
ncbi:hypothetical protein POTOM_018892 [Populus tomentosa]|uniref:SAP domain-containing protein n=1 Tax=Populus tomentosa TaxID=118781 RepID=A0A8X7ZTR5_POPTO|nr:hypothetical protein POTOM_018892 [Populus tomentosa]